MLHPHWTFLAISCNSSVTTHLCSKIHSNFQSKGGKMHTKPYALLVQNVSSFPHHLSAAYLFGSYHAALFSCGISPPPCCEYHQADPRHFSTYSMLHDNTRRLHISKTKCIYSVWGALVSTKLWLQPALQPFSFRLNPWVPSLLQPLLLPSNSRQAVISSCLPAIQTKWKGSPFSGSPPITSFSASNFFLVSYFTVLQWITQHSFQGLWLLP